MAIFNDEDRLQQWKYHVSEIMLLIPGEEQIVIPSERLKEMIIIDEFEKNAFPLFKITLVLESDIYYKLTEHKNDGKVHLRIDKYYTYLDSTTKSIYSKFINDNFDMIMDENKEDMLRTLKEEENKNDYNSIIKSDKNKIDNVDNTISIYLFKSNVLGSTKANVNAVLQNSTVTDAIAYIATKSKINNILMGRTDNNKLYSELLIPPLSVFKNISFIDTYYGLYEEGSFIYYGLQYTYILPYNGKCEAYVDNEIRDIAIIIPKSSDERHSSNLGSLDKKSDLSTHYIIGDYRTIDTRNESISHDYLEANNIMAIDSYSGEINYKKSNAKSKGENFTRIYENKTENPYIASAYTAQTAALSDVIPIRLQSFNVEDLAPNKRIKLIFEDRNLINKYKGNYIISNVRHAFISDGEDFYVSSTALFKREN